VRRPSFDRSNVLARGRRRFLAIPIAKQLLNAANGVAFVVEEAIDPPCEIDVRRAIITAVACALHWLQLRETRLPIAEDVLGDSQLLRQFADRQ